MRKLKYMRNSNHLNYTFLFTLGAALLAAALSPLEKTLGLSSRLVYLHGAWVWAILLVFALGAVAGAVGLLTRKPVWHTWSLTLSRAGLVFWLVSLGMSLAVMRINWGGFFFDEPRWRIPFAFAVTGLLLQAAILLIGIPWLASAGSLVFGAALLYTMSDITSVLHPDSPILTSSSIAIRVFFFMMLLLVLAAAVQLAALFKRQVEAHV
jgi:hypothetical protein